MHKKQKKNFTKARKFEELQQDRKAKLRERGVQKRTGYERDIRTLMKSILVQVTAAEEGTGEITREELVYARNQLDKLITKTRVLSGNKGVDLSSIKLKIETQKAIVLDYITGKRELAGKVGQHGQKPGVNRQVEFSGNGTSDDFSSDKFSHTVEERGFESVERPRHSSKEEYYRNLGFDDDNYTNPVPQKQPASHSPIQRSSPEAFEKDEQLKKVSLTLIDSKISKIINEGIEHLMHYRRNRAPNAPGYADEIKRFINEEIGFEKRKAVVDMQNRGYNEAQLQGFARLFDREIETNRNWMARKCLYMSRVLEYRKGSTASG